MLVPTHNIDAAKKYGDFVIMLPPMATRLALAPLIEVMKEKMADFNGEDYLLAMGDPSIIAAASVIAHQKAGCLRMLKWDRRSFDYIDVRISI